MKTYLLTTLFFSLAVLQMRAQSSPAFVYFQQDFCDPNVPLQSESPNSEQVDYVITTSSATVLTGNCYVDAVRSEGTGGGSVRVLRTTPLLTNTTAQTLHFRATLDVPEITQEGMIAAYFGIGDQLPTNTTLISNATLFSKLSIDFNSDGSYNFRVAQAGGPKLSEPLNGRVTMTWVLNNSQENLIYLTPDQKVASLEPGRYDVWIDQEKWVAGGTRLSDVPLNNFAFILSNGVGTVRLYNIEISNNGFQLPLILTRFKAEQKLQTTQLYWEMASGHTASYFMIERGTDGVSFEPIGGVSVPEQLDRKEKFDFVDAAPAKGLNYYRLKMMGVDGEIKYSQVETVYFDPLQPTLTLAPNPADPGKITVLASGIKPERLSLISLDGLLRPFQYHYDPSSQLLEIYPTNTLPAGVYLLRLEQRPTLKTLKVIIP